MTPAMGEKRYIGRITQVTRAVGRPIGPDEFEPHPEDLVQVLLEDGELVSTFRLLVHEVVDLYTVHIRLNVFQYFQGSTEGRFEFETRKLAVLATSPDDAEQRGFTWLWKEVLSDRAAKFFGKRHRDADPKRISLVGFEAHAVEGGVVVV